MVHRATFVGIGEFEQKPPDGRETKYEKQLTLECFPHLAGNNLLVIFNRPPWTYWSFLNLESERHDDKEERITGVPAFAPTGESEAVIQLYEVPASDNKATFNARFTLGGVNWRVDFKGNQTFPP